MRGKIYTGGASPMFPQPPKGSARRPQFDTDALLRMPVSEGLASWRKLRFTSHASRNSFSGSMGR